MKSILIPAIFTNLVFAQLLSIQGIARDNNGASLADGDYNFVFRLYENETGGTAVWTETQTLTVTNGVFSANLGSEVSMEDLDFNTEYWISLQIGTGNDELSPRSKLTLTPYAIMAQLNGATNIVPSTGNVGIGTTSPDTTLSVAGPIRAANDSTQIEYVEIGHDGSDGIVNTVGDGNLVFQHDGTALVSIEDNGNVGIGTADPSKKLEVDGTIEVTDGVLFSGGTQDIQWEDGETLQFGTVSSSDGSFTEKLKIKSGGDVVIGESEKYDDYATSDADLGVEGDVLIDGKLLFNQFHSQLNNAKGYAKMGTFVIQWGTETSTSDASQSFSFRRQFTTCYSVVMTRVDDNGTAALMPESWNASSFSIDRNNSFDGSHTFTYIAVGVIN